MASVIRSLGWNVAGQVARALTQFALGVVLARLLGPEAFGVMAVVWMAVAFCRLIDPGMGSSLVQLATPSAEEIRYATTWQIGISLLLGTLLAIAARPVSQLLGDAAAAPYLRPMAILLPLFAVAQIGNALLELRLDFRTIQLANLIPYVIGYLGLGVPMAIAGYGPWALVTAAVSQNVLTTTWLYAATRHPWRPLVRIASGRRIAGFGAHTSGVALATYVASNSDQVAVSHSGTAAELGQYNRAGALLSTPMLALGNALTNWLYPLFVRQTAAVRQAGFISAVTWLMLFTAVPFAVVAGCAGSVVWCVYGPGWETCARYCVPLSLAMPAWLLGMVASPLLWSCDAVAADHRRQWVATCLGLLALGSGVAAGCGPLGFAWIVCGCSWVRAGMLLSAAQAVAGWSWSHLMRAVLPTFAIAAGAGLGAAWMESALEQLNCSRLTIVVTASCSGLVAIALALWLGRALYGSSLLTNIIMLKVKN